MLIKVSKKIDRFYFVFAIALIIMAVVVTVIMRSIFGAFRTASEINEELFSSSVPRINKERIDNVLKKIEFKEIPPLDLKD